MVLTLISILWLVFIIMGVSIMFLRIHQNNQLLGVTLSKKHANTDVVKNIVNAFTQKNILISILFLALSLLLFFPAVQHYSEIFLLLLVIGNIFGHLYLFNHYQKLLIQTKTEQGWTYPRKKIIAVDLKVTREKGKASISPLPVWLFLGISIIPFIYLLANPDLQAMFPLWLTLTGPCLQIIGVMIYYHMRNQKLTTSAENTKINLAYAKQVERANSISATLSAMILLIFWLGFCFSIFYSHNHVAIILPITFLTLGMLGGAIWHQRKLNSLEKTFLGNLEEQDEQVYEQEGTWKWGLYHNPSDPRFLVPKQLASFGWTINTAHRGSKFFIWGTVILILAVIVLVTYGGIKDYEFSLTENQLIIDAAMYDRTYSKDEIISIETITNLPSGLRTNGYGGANRSYGHFTFDGYGQTMLYVYHNVGQYIVIELVADNPGYVIINQKTQTETTNLYQDLITWAEL